MVIVMTESSAPGYWPSRETAVPDEDPAGKNLQGKPPNQTDERHAAEYGDAGPGDEPIHGELTADSLFPGYIHATRMDAPREPWSPPAAHPPRHYLPDEPAPAPNRRPRRRNPNPRLRNPRWLLLASVSVIAGAATAAVILAHGGGTAAPAGAAGRAGASRAGTAQRATGGTGQGQPVITRATAQRVLTAYTTANNQANKLRENSLLGAIETGSSYQMDAGGYQFLRASDPAGTDYAPMELTDPAFYIPREAASVYPQWFVAKVTYVYPQNPANAPGPGYVLFTQASPDAAWKDALEPNILTGSAPLPKIAADAQGYAEPVSVAPGTSGLSVAPDDLAVVTAGALDGSAAAKITVPGNLQDQKDQAFWRSRLPQGSTDTDTHLQAPGAVYGLRTADGGALLFYTLNAQLTLAPPAGQSFQIAIPGYYSPASTQTRAVVGYIDQFAAYDPPHSGSPRITADTSGIASRG